MLSTEDYDLCHQLVTKLASESYSSLNYLFLEPVDTTYFPTYDTIISRPMDLGTLRRLLEERETYKTIEEFFSDLMLTFQNAINFHSDIKDNAWIVKLAKDMTKLVNREWKAALQKRSKQWDATPAVTTTTTTTTNKSKKRKRSTTAAESATAADNKKQKAAIPAAVIPDESSAPAPTVVVKKSKISIKPKLEKEKTQTEKKPTETDEGALPKSEKKSSKPKIKLRLSLTKTKSEEQLESAEQNTLEIKNKSKSKSKGSTATSSSSSNASRGKELPKKVAAMQQKQGPETVSDVELSKIGKQWQKTQPTQPAALKQASLPALRRTASQKPSLLPNIAMTEERKVQCLKFISALKRRHHRNVSWFVKPVNDARIVEDYTAKIPHPIDLGTAATKIETGQYKTVPEFVLDIRRIFGNCLRYNTTTGDSFRPVAVDMARDAESLFNFFLQQSPGMPSIIIPPLLYCWQVCIASLDVLLAMKSADDELPTAHFFLHPASFYFGGEFPQDYKLKVPQPMDLGTVTSNLMEGVYQSVSKFVADCSLVCQNCYKYNADNPDGAALVAHAKALEAQMQQQLGMLIRYDASPEGREAERISRIPAPLIIPAPPKQFLLAMLHEMRENIYTDRFTKLTERAAAPFEKPVDLSIFPDYLDYVKRPMCLEMIQKNIEMNAYQTPEDFEFDMQQIFKNCEDYNLPKKNEHIIAVSKHLSKVFRKLYHNRTRNYEENAKAGNLGLPTSGATPPADLLLAPAAKLIVDEKRSSSPSPSISSQVSSATSQVGEKRLKITGKAPSKRSVPRALSWISTDTSPKSRSSTPRLGGKKMGGKKSVQSGDADGATSGGVSFSPITLNEAIERVRAQYPGMRQIKALESWESTCHRFYRELLRHPWLSGANPKFIYHAPITTIFPEIADVYCAKIDKPMDLSTAEAKLLSGGLYFQCQDFVNDIALVFANAISFNKIGRDEGVATSCAYFDASTHLLRYSRWLSLDILSNYLVDDSEIGAAPKDGSYSDWKLTTSYKCAARAEMENLVLKHQFEKSDVGDKFNWKEAEIEKLLKSLRYQSDLRYMTYFISPNYPADYAAFISKPMAWETAQRALQERKYDTFGEAVEDLRLIFSNALRYNARAKGTDTVSGRAYDSAVYMSIKLEAAIQRMLLTVSDRLEREKVEEAIAEREAEAAERSAALRAREEQIRLQSEWERERALLTKNSQANITALGQQMTDTSKVIIKPKLTIKRQSLNFDFEFNEDDVDNTSNHMQSHMEALRQQKALFEKQKSERKKYVQTSKYITSSLYFKLAQKEKQIAAEAALSQQQEKSSIGIDAMCVDEPVAAIDNSETKQPESSEVTFSVSSIATDMMPAEKKAIKIALPTVNKKERKCTPEARFGRIRSSFITLFDD